MLVSAQACVWLHNVNVIICVWCWIGFEICECGVIIPEYSKYAAQFMLVAFGDSGLLWIARNGTDMETPFWSLEVCKMRESIDPIPSQTVMRHVTNLNQNDLFSPLYINH